MTTLKGMTVEHLGTHATEADLEAFRAAVRARVEAGETEESAIETLWNDGGVLPEARAASEEGR